MAIAEKSYFIYKVTEKSYFIPSFEIHGSYFIWKCQVHTSLGILPKGGGLQNYFFHMLRERLALSFPGSLLHLIYLKMYLSECFPIFSCPVNKMVPNNCILLCEKWPWITGFHVRVGKLNFNVQGALMFLEPETNYFGLLNSWNYSNTM